MYNKQLQAVDLDLKKENKAREMAVGEEDDERDAEEGEDLEAKKKANQLKDDIALVIAIILILILTATIVFGKVKQFEFRKRFFYFGGSFELSYLPTLTQILRWLTIANYF